MKNTLLQKLIVALVVFVGIAAVMPANAARAPRPGNTTQPPTTISGL
jgi:hypothetical protein